MASKSNTTIYNWPEGSLIRQIEVRQQQNGRAVAYIEADNTESAQEKRQNIRSALRLKGWGTLSDHHDGRFQLRVSGLRSGDEVLSMLRAEGFISGEPVVSNVAEKAEKPKGLWETIKANSLRLSAVIYTLGDLFYFKGSDTRFDKRMALSFGSGDALLGVFGGRDDSRQFKGLLTKLQHHMEKDGIEIPKNASIYVETAQKGQGLWERTMDFLHSHINSIKILSEIVGGYFVLQSGLERDPNGNRNIFKIISGPIIIAGWIGALLIKEKKPDEEALKNAGSVDKAISFIQEKPLRLAGWAGLSFNALKVTDVFVNQRKTGPWNAAGVAAMVSANSLYAISNKTVGGDIKTDEMVSDVYSVAAQILNKQPEDVRELAIASTAKFLGERPEIKDNHQEIVIRLRHEMDIQRQNPWFEKIGLPPSNPQILAQTDAVNAVSAPTTTVTKSPTSTAATPATTISSHAIAHEAMSPAAARQQQLA